MPTMGFTLHHNARSATVPRLMYYHWDKEGKLKEQGEANQSRVIEVLHGDRIEINVTLNNEKGEPL